MLALGRHHDFDLAAPTPDHYIPVLYLAGLAAASGETADVFTEGYFGGSLSMTSYTIGLDSLATPDDTAGAPPLPDVPADETNL
jgi:4,5-DOPA dioxygenase extradiol